MCVCVCVYSDLVLEEGGREGGGADSELVSQCGFFEKVLRDSFRKRVVNLLLAPQSGLGWPTSSTGLWL